jgi:hypothetical protein
VDELMCHVLCSGAKLKHGKDLGEGVNGQPKPQHLGGAPSPGAQFVQLEIWQMQSAKEAFVQALSVQPSTSEPGGDGGLTVAEDPRGLRKIQLFGQRRQNHGDLLGGSFQPVQRRVAPRTERRATSRTSKGLDPLDMAMLAISEKPGESEHQ